MSRTLAQTNSWRCLEFLQPPASPYLWADKSAPATGQRFYRAVVFAAPTNLVFIPPGTFRMGSPTNEVDRFRTMEGPQTAVTISRGFWMGKYEVTQGEYLAVMSTIQFTATSYTTNESAGTVTLTVQRTGDTNTEVGVDYATADGTATNGLKYTAVSGTLAFGASETNKTIVVPILNNGFVERHQDLPGDFEQSHRRGGAGRTHECHRVHHR